MEDARTTQVNRYVFVAPSEHNSTLRNSLAILEFLLQNPDRD